MTGAKHVVLIGLPGVGKTTVGRSVAKRLARPFVDLDRLIERSFGKSVTEIFRDHGEAAFRTAEARVSQEAGQMEAAVLAPGGGWILNAGAVAHLLETSRIIYLRVSPEAAIRRMGRGVARRPLLSGSGEPAEVMRRLYQERRPAYERYAGMVVETGGLQKSAVVTRVVQLVLAAERDIVLHTENTND